jgi:hypothetical protein
LDLTHRKQLSSIHSPIPSSRRERSSDDDCEDWNAAGASLSAATCGTLSTFSLTALEWSEISSAVKRFEIGLDSDLSGINTLAECRDDDFAFNGSNIRRTSSNLIQLVVYPSFQFCMVPIDESLMFGIILVIGPV